ncbi:MAG: hypothetical protein PHH36_00870 [Sideroxydans sp.]|nr:hypothetical protein [Sideroxydans sp.]
MRIVRLFACIVVLISAVLSGCASSGPSPDVMRAEVAGYQLPRMPAGGKAIVYVVFEEDYYDMAAFDVFLDGQETASRVGRNHGGQYFFFEMAPGEHKLFSRGEKWAELAVSAKAGEVIFIRQELVFGMMAARVNLLRLDEVEGKYYVSKLKRGEAVQPLATNRPATSAQGTTAGTAVSDTFIGIVTGGNMAKGIGFSNLNVKLFVTPAEGGPVVFFVRSDSKVYDAGGREIDYLEASRTKGKKVEIRYFVIQDATGGEPGRSDFAYEIGEKGARTLHILE